MRGLRGRVGAWLGGCAWREAAMSRRVYLLGVGLALVALALAFTDWALSLQPGVTEANAKRIRAGMTLAEVEALLGGPAVEEKRPWEPFDTPVETNWARERYWRGRGI